MGFIFAWQRKPCVLKWHKITLNSSSFIVDFLYATITPFCWPTSKFDFENNFYHLGPVSFNYAEGRVIIPKCFAKYNPSSVQALTRG
jgi:hypothetical protein